MNNTIIICLVLLAIVFILIRLERRIVRLEKVFGEIISGEMLRGFYDAMKEAMSKPDSPIEIKPMSQETAEELNALSTKIKDESKDQKDR